MRWSVWKNEAVAVAAMRASNPDRPPFTINGRNPATTPSGFAEIVSVCFPSEVRGELESQLQSQSFLNAASGETWTSAGIEQRKEQIKKDRPAMIKSIEAAQAKFTKCHNYRNVFLLLGFVGLVVSKIGSSSDFVPKADRLKAFQASRGINAPLCR